MRGWIFLPLGLHKRNTSTSWKAVCSSRQISRSLATVLFLEGNGSFLEGYLLMPVVFNRVQVLLHARIKIGWKALLRDLLELMEVQLRRALQSNG